MSINQQPRSVSLGSKALPGIIAAVITFIAYIPSLSNGFVSWDDGTYVVDNLVIRAIDLDLLKAAFTGVFAGNWQPLTVFSYALDYAVWGLNPFGYHLVNSSLHAVNAFLVALLTIELAQAAFLMKKEETNGKGLFLTGLAAGLLFGLHPQHVESVAWVSERKDVLSGLFFILSILSYIRYAKGGKAYYLISFFTFALALMSKSMAVTLPVVLLLLDYYPLGRLSKPWKVLLEKVPFFVLSLLTGLAAIWSQSVQKALSVSLHPFGTRVLVAIKSFVFYIWKMLLPVDLAPFYPYPKDVSFLRFEYAGAFLIVLAITVVCVILAKRNRAFVSAWLAYIITLLPVIGVIQVGMQSAADRYMYIPSIPLFVLSGAGVYLFVKGRERSFYPAVAVTVIVSAALLFLTVRQSSIWKDTPTLWTYEISIYPDSADIAYYNRALYYKGQGLYGQSVADLDKAVSINPRFADAYNNRGNVRKKLGDLEGAMKDYMNALESNPNYSAAYFNLGLAYAEAGDHEKAIESMRQAARLGMRSAQEYLVQAGEPF